MGATASHFLSQSETNFYSNTVSQSYFLYARDCKSLYICSLHLRFKSLSLSLYIYIYIGKFLGGPGLQGWQADLVVPTNKHKTTH